MSGKSDWADFQTICDHCERGVLHTMLFANNRPLSHVRTVLNPRAVIENDQNGGTDRLFVICLLLLPQPPHPETYPNLSPPQWQALRFLHSLAQMRGKSV